MENTQQFLFYDLETWSLVPQAARLVEFAAIRVNADLQQIEDPIKLICKPSPECVSDPDALLVHGKTPQWAQAHGQSEYQCAREMFAQLNRHNACLIGYNNLRYDDNVVRFVFYRNLFDPYTHQWQNNNSRWDILDLVRLAYALRPETLTWADDSLKLEDLAQANQLPHTQAHDALSDVETTLALARLIRQAQPKMFDYAFRVSRGVALQEQVSTYLGKVCLHISPRFARKNGHMAIIYPVCRSSANPKQVLAVVLNYPVDMLFAASVDEIREHIFTKEQDKVNGLRIKIIHLNRAPLLLPLSLLSDQRAEQLGIDKQASIQRYMALQQHKTLGKIMQQVLVEDNPFATAQCMDDPEQALYQGFIPNADKKQSQVIHQQSSNQWGNIVPSWQDSRMHSLWLRLQGREAPETLNATQKRDWRNYLAKCLDGRMPHLLGIENALIRCQQHLDSQPDNQQLQQLYQYLLQQQQQRIQW